MSKLAHSDTLGMATIDVRRAIESGDEDLICDAFAAAHQTALVGKIVKALTGKKGTALRYAEVRQLARLLVGGVKP
jgi:ribosomal silencing factor RsfS